MVPSAPQESHTSPGSPAVTRSGEASARGVIGLPSDVIDRCAAAIILPRVSRDRPGRDCTQRPNEGLLRHGGR
jgi:hypothetical protein